MFFLLLMVFCVSGPVSAVGDLFIAESTTSLTISWTPPFSLDVTVVDPDIWYSVFIYNVTDENNPTAILCTNCTNITETHYTFTPDYLTPCHVYKLSVIPFNGAGQGESSPYVTRCAEYGVLATFVSKFCLLVTLSASCYTSFVLQFLTLL